MSEQPQNDPDTRDDEAPLPVIITGCRNDTDVIKRVLERLRELPAA
jgi:hypothetical protein